MPTSFRIKCTDELGNVSYLFKRNGEWSCVLANGTPASFSYAGIHGDEMAAIFRLEDAATVEDAVAVAKNLGSPRARYEVV